MHAVIGYALRMEMEILLRLLHSDRFPVCACLLGNLAAEAAVTICPIKVCKRNENVADRS